MQPSKNHFKKTKQNLIFVHKRNATPQKVPGGAHWNCSVPHWPDFRPHFLCNRKSECAGGEDERECPYTLCQNDGVVVAGRCYFLSETAMHSTTWIESSLWCNRNGGRLASLNTAEKWQQVPSLLNIAKYVDYVYYVGITTSPSSFPRMLVMNIIQYNTLRYNTIKTIQLCCPRRVIPLAAI